MTTKRSESISLPRDAGAHLFSNIEWWYFFAYLDGDKGGKYAVMASFFETGELLCEKGHYLIYTLIDLNKRTRQNYSLFDSKLKWNMIFMYLPLYLLQNSTNCGMWRLFKSLLNGEIPFPHNQMEKAAIKRNPLGLIYGDNLLWFNSEDEDFFMVHLAKKDIEIDLKFTPAKPMSLIGRDGKPDNLYYYSFTRNLVQGQIQTSEGIENVRGQGWFDHQWGRDYGLIKGIGWNWFGLQLNDGRELLLNERLSSKSKRSFSPMANLIEEGGSLKFTREVFCKERKFWHSHKTDAIYPIEWKIIIPDFSIELDVKADIPEQEMPIFGPLQAIWEGTCILSGQEILPNKKRISLAGKGFMELVGYLL
jgi:predicted secreted hydrolase